MNDQEITRRNFVKVTTAGTLGLISSGNFAYASSSDVLRIGVIGCGGRGTGAARDAVISSEAVEIVAMGDLFHDRLDASREALKQEIGNAYQVDDSHAFVGFDAYQHVLDSDIDLVILASPPGFRPKHFTAAVDAGKHIFMEKPVGVDVAGALKIMSAGEIATSKGLSVVAGTLYRRQPSFVEGIKRIHDGMIGKILAAQEYYLTGPIWLRERKAGMSDMEWQCRNWYYFTWLSGDHIVEQFVHNIDVINWVFQSHPDQAIAMGGRISRTSPEYGHIYDHFSVEYIYPNDVVVEAKCRQFSGTTNRVANRIVGTKGIAHLNPQHCVINDLSGNLLYEMPEPGANGYVQEHTDLIASVRDGNPINETNQIATSTLTGVLGRESAYTGQQLSWDELISSGLDLQPSNYHEFGQISAPPVPEPGVTTLSRTPPLSVQNS